MSVLIAALQDMDDGLRQKAAMALGKLGVRAKVAVPALAAALNDYDENVRRGAAQRCRRSIRMRRQRQVRPDHDACRELAQRPNLTRRWGADRRSLRSSQACWLLAAAANSRVCDDADQGRRSKTPLPDL